MLPDIINRIVVSALDQVLLEAHRRAANDSRKVVFDFANRGLLISGAAAGALLEAHVVILEDMSARALNEMKRVLNEAHVAPYREIENDLNDLLVARLTALKNLLRRNIEVSDKSGHTNMVLPQFDERYKTVESKYKNEIGIFCVALNAKTAEMEANRMSSNITYNLHGDNPRIVINSQDYSINIANSKVVFEAIQRAVSSQIQDEKLRDDLRNKIAEMEGNVGKASFLKSYSDFVALAANHMTILGPFLPALTQFLQVGITA